MLITHTPTIAIPKAITKRVPRIFRIRLLALVITRMEMLAPSAITSTMPNSGSMIMPVARNSCFISFLSI